jgi:hypothetical protein
VELELFGTAVLYDEAEAPLHRQVADPAASQIESTSAARFRARTRSTNGIEHRHERVAHLMRVSPTPGRRVDRTADRTDSAPSDCFDPMPCACSGRRGDSDCSSPSCMDK